MTQQGELFGAPTDDVEDRRAWTWRAASAARWLRPPRQELAAETAEALQRTPHKAAYSKRQYKLWNAGETRPIPTTFYDGTTDDKRLRLAAKLGRLP